MDTTKGAFVIDKNNVTIWSPTGQIPDETTNSSSANESYKCEKYTGQLDRNDFVPKKPVPSMSYGGRVRIARLYQSYEEFVGKIIKVGGWAKSTRASSSEFCFIELNDGSCFKNLQVVVNKTVGSAFEDVAKGIVGASFMFKGELIKSPAKGQDFELQVKDAELHSATVCGHSDGTYPIQGRPKLEVSKQLQHSHLFSFIVPERASSP